MKCNVFNPEVVEMKSLKNLFIELTAKNCNQHCKYCYIDFPKYKKTVDFINIDIINKALKDTIGDDIECIYLTGAEPMTHPDFNAILRLCLKRTNVCICTNGSFINEKKTRFLKKVEDESEYEIFFKLSLSHYDEVKNDDIRYRGAYRHTIFAMKHLLKYDFNLMITFSNFYNLPIEEISNGISYLFKKNSFDLDFSNVQVIPWYSNEHLQIDSNPSSNIENLDCRYGRVLTTNGVYVCPFLTSDYRGRCGSDFSDYNKKSSLETSFCKTCMQTNKQIFAIDFNVF